MDSPLSPASILLGSACGLELFFQFEGELVVSERHVGGADVCLDAGASEGVVFARELLVEFFQQLDQFRDVIFDSALHEGRI
jgi:hypothetical protein